jgi:hypothetical protein
MQLEIWLSRLFKSFCINIDSRVTENKKAHREESDISDDKVPKRKKSSFQNTHKIDEAYNYYFSQ